MEKGYFSRKTARILQARTGFTLIELLVVIAIIGILAAVSYHYLTAHVYDKVGDDDPVGPLSDYPLLLEFLPPGVESVKGPRVIPDISRRRTDIAYLGRIPGAVEILIGALLHDFR